MDDRSGAPAGGAEASSAAGVPAARPGRAELRRAAEAEAQAAAAASASRVERRRQAEQASKNSRARTSIWRAWWLYPLVALIGVCVYLGFQSAADAPAPSGPIVEITEAP